MRPPTGKLLVACSGGRDSRTLLDVLYSLVDQLELKLAVACVDHGLRPEAAEEASQVRQTADALGLPAAVLPITVPSPSMAAARRARYDALIAYARTQGAEAIAVAHTATDQAETLLDRLLRGAGTRGLAAMARSRPIAPHLQLIRPLLDISRQEVTSYVAARGLFFVDDPTNRNPSYRRSRLRQEVMPLLRRERPDLDLALAGLCDRLRADAEALETEAERAHAALLQDDGLDCLGLGDLPDAIAARVVARAAGIPLESVHIEAIRRLCSAVHGTRSIDLPQGIVAERRYDRLRFGPRLLDPGDVELPVPGPGRYHFLRVAVEVDPAAFDCLADGGRLVLRNFRRGDVVRSGKLKELLIDHKVPRPERRWLPLLVRRLDVPIGEAGSSAEPRAPRVCDELRWVPGVFGDGCRMSALTQAGRVQ
jgi:tRNA(Ile)-lysidine synthase